MSSRLDWNERWGGALGSDHELIEVLAFAGLHAAMSGEVAIPAVKVDGWHDMLGIAVAAGWLAPIETLDDGSIRTTLTIPEGV